MKHKWVLHWMIRWFKIPLRVTDCHELTLEIWVLPGKEMENGTQQGEESEWTWSRGTFTGANGVLALARLDQRTPIRLHKTIGRTYKNQRKKFPQFSKRRTCCLEKKKQRCSRSMKNVKPHSSLKECRKTTINILLFLAKEHRCF